MNLRVGSGYDVHRLESGRPLVLGGVQVPFRKGLLGYSDADVLCHAVADALLGAGRLGDVGQHFPDSDPKFRGVCSLLLLERVAKLLKDKGLAIVNVDATVIAEEPKLSPHIPQMVHNIAVRLGVPDDVVSVKATTTEGLGFAGKGLGMAAQAVALLCTH